MYNVLIVDDERLVQELFTRYIESTNGRYHLLGVLAEASNAEVMCSRYRVDLILMDVCTAHNASGLGAAARIKERFPNTKIIIVTSAPEFRFIQKARDAKADSFWYKNVSESELLDVMDKTMGGEHIYPEQTPRVDIGYASSDEFTKRELEVLLHLAQGVSTREIAQKLGISTDGVNEHIKHLKEKTGCATKTRLAILASTSKLVLPEYYRISLT